MKKIFSLILAILTLFSLTSCANEPKEVVPITPAESFSRGSGTEADPYVISTAEELMHLQAAVNEQDNTDYLDGHFRLARDIDLGGNAWRPIGMKTDGEALPFNGTFDGAGKKILNFTCSMPEEERTRVYLGLFFAVHGTVKNLTVDRCTVSGTEKSAAGAITGYLHGGELQNCSVGKKAVITGDAAGGLAGQCWAASVENCANAATVTGLRWAGGIFGIWTVGAWRSVSGKFHMDNCSNAGSITGGRYVGGLTGSLSAECIGEITLNNCSNAGEILLDGRLDYDNPGAPHAVGGIVGNVSGMKKELNIGLLACSNAGSVNEKNCAGDSYAGGLVGSGGIMGGLTLLSCSNAGKVEGALTVGGLLGQAVNNLYETDTLPTLSVSACTNAGAVSGSVVGGLVGSLCATGNALEATFENCVNSADVRVNSGIPGCGGGLIGGMTNAIPTRLAHCTCDGDVSAREAENFQGSSGHLGGLIGWALEYEPILEGCSFTGTVSDNEGEHYIISEDYTFTP